MFNATNIRFFFTFISFILCLFGYATSFSSGTAKDQVASSEDTFTHVTHAAVE